MYRSIGCMGCSEDLAKRAADFRVDPDSTVNYVLITRFGDDDLPDAIQVNVGLREWSNIMEDVSLSALLKTIGREGILVTDRPASAINVIYEAIALEHSGIKLDVRHSVDRAWPRLVVRTPEDWARFLDGFGRRSPRSSVEVHELDRDLYMFTYSWNELVISSLDSRSSYATPINEGTDVVRDGAGYWVGDFDDDGEAELGLTDRNVPFKVVEVSGGFRDNPDATKTIAQATKDFANNLLTDDAGDFELLWKEHGPSASVAALALVLNLKYDELLRKLQTAAGRNENFRETIVEIREN